MRRRSMPSWLAAGGQVDARDGAGPLPHGKPGFWNPHFVASGLPG